MMEVRSELRSPVGGSGGGGGGGSACFPSGTLVTTPEGARDICTLKKGDFVVTFGESSSTKVSRRILKVTAPRPNRIWNVTFTDGHRIRTTASHSLCVDGTWKKVGSIKAGDYLLCLDGATKLTRQVLSLSPEDQVEDVFNVVVEGNFTFLADGVLAHSFSNFRTIQVWGWTVYSVTCAAWRWLAREQRVFRALPARA